MCTYLTDKTSKIADKDIEVYKVVAVEGSRYLYSPCFYGMYQSNDLYTELGELEGLLHLEYPYAINKGWHSYHRLEDSMEFMNTVFYLAMSQKTRFRVFHVIKAIIPKGSHYYSGKTYINEENPYVPGYVSDRLILHPENVFKTTSDCHTCNTSNFNNK